MIEVIRHTSGYSGSPQQSSKLDPTLFMDTSPVFPQSIYTATPSNRSVEMMVATADALRQLPSTSTEHDSKVKVKRSSKKDKPGRREKIPEGTLCVVCSDLASGIHYSVASCNGCKTFFRRALVNKQAFQCQFSDDCIVDKSVRCGCRSCRLKKCFQMGMNPNAIQHDRDKIRYTKRAKKIKEEGAMEISDITNGKAGFMKEEADSPQSNQTADEMANMSSPSSSLAGHGPGSNAPSFDHEIHDIQTEMSAVLTDLLILERKINDVRCANRFPPHTSVASCMYDRRLLDDDAWVSTYSTPLSPAFNPIPCDRESMRAWFVKDLTLMIEWAKCLPQMGQLLLNDKLALIKAFAPVFPLIQLAYFSCTHESRRRSSTESPIDESFSSPSGVTSSTSRLSLESNGGAELAFMARTVDRTPTLDRLWYPDGRYLEREDLDTNSAASNKKELPINALLIDGVCHQMLRLRLSESHVVLYKLMLFFNPDADGLSSTGKSTIESERVKLLNYLYVQIIQDRAGKQGTELYSNILLMTTTLIRVASFLKRTFDISHIFGPADDLIDQLIIVGL
uniref:Nuclear hormone receptor family member nhr-40 n=1 Tax=Ascaris suum TaxID=6253 RepID=F1KW50_ASCSU